MKKILVFMVAAAGLVGCGATEEQLRARAAFDLKCDESQLEIVPIDERTRGVRGCGHQGTYVESCAQQNRTNCSWILNSDDK